MECKDYIEAIAADPSGSFEGCEHSQGCEACREFRDEMVTLDQKIARALEINVPELAMPELPPIGEEDSNVVNLPFKREGRSKVPVWLGLAASVVVAIVLGMKFFEEDVVYPSLGAEIMAHLDHEARSMRVTDDAVSDRRLDKVLREDVAEMNRDIGIVSYARTCEINGNEIPHLVIQGKQGPITLLLLPDEKIDGVVPLVGEGTQGVLLPVGDGSIAIVGERGERLEELEEQLVDSVKWNI
jgi:hypothetical protein